MPEQWDPPAQVPHLNAISSSSFPTYQEKTRLSRPRTRKANENEKPPPPDEIGHVYSRLLGRTCLEAGSLPNQPNLPQYISPAQSTHISLISPCRVLHPLSPLFDVPLSVSVFGQQAMLRFLQMTFLLPMFRLPDLHASSCRSHFTTSSDRLSAPSPILLPPIFITTTQAWCSSTC